MVFVCFVFLSFWNYRQTKTQRTKKPKTKKERNLYSWLLSFRFGEVSFFFVNLIHSLDLFLCLVTSEKCEDIY